MSARLRSFIAASLLLPVLAASPLADAEPVRAAVPGPVDGARAVPGPVDWSGAQTAIAVQLWYSTVVWNNALEADRVAHLPRQRATARPSTRSHGASSGVEACILARENGGDYGRSRNPSHFGAYQFDRQTWAANGGDPSTWGSASPAEQDTVFHNTVAAHGYSAWTPYDGC